MAAVAPGCWADAEADMEGAPTDAVAAGATAADAMVLCVMNGVERALGKSSLHRRFLRRPAKGLILHPSSTQLITKPKLLSLMHNKKNPYTL